PRAVRDATTRVARRPRPARRRDPIPPPLGHTHVRQRLPPLGLRRTRADPSPAPRRVAREHPLAKRRQLLQIAHPRPRMSSAASRETRLPLRDAPAEGTVRMIELEGHQIGLYTLAGAVYAIANRCPHRGAPLCAGKIATPIQTEADGIGLGQPNSILRCPWHKWEFDIATGRCL